MLDPRFLQWAVRGVFLGFLIAGGWLHSIIAVLILMRCRIPITARVFRFAVWPYGMLVFVVIALIFSVGYRIGLDMRGHFGEPVDLRSFLERPEFPDPRRHFDLLARLELLEAMRKADDENEP